MIDTGMQKDCGVLRARLAILRLCAVLMHSEQRMLVFRGL
jgi:hypothetical protein